MEKSLQKPQDKAPPPLQKNQTRKALIFELLFVTLAFAFMVVSSTLYVRNMLRNHLSRQAADMLTQTKLEIKSGLAEPQTVLTVISNTVRNMILQGSDANSVQEYIKNIRAEIDEKEIGVKFEGIYGYFECFGGALLHSEEWENKEDYNPTERPWYKTAITAGNKIAVTPMYLNMRLNDYLITFVHRIFDTEGYPLGMVCLEVPLDRIRNSVVGMNIADGGYGILINEEMIVVAHPAPALTGSHARTISVGMTELVDELESGNDVFEWEMKNYLDEQVVAFNMRLENNWVLTLMTPKATYYKEMQNMKIMIGILGTIFAGILIIILIRIDSAKNKSDEQNRKQTLRLADMEKMREADERTQIILDATPLGCKLWDKNHNIIECSQEILNLFDLQNKQEFFDNFFRLVPEYQPNGRLSTEMAAEYINNTFKTGYNHFECMHQKLNGEPIPAEITLVRLKYKDDYVVAGYIRDLREHNQMMKKIELRDNLLNTVNQAAVVLLSIEDEKNMKTSILAGMELLGRSVDVDRVQIWQNEIIDNSLHYVHKYEWLSEVGRQKAPVPIGLHFPYSDNPEWENKFLNGECINGPLCELSPGDQELLSPFDVKSIVITPLFLQDHFWGFFSIDDCRNERTFSEEEVNILRSGGLLITNAFLHSDMMENISSSAIMLETALKETKEANEAKSKFLANMSHEIRTPMNVILGITESQFINENLPQEAREAFEKIFNSGNLLLHIINDILDLSKIEAGKFELYPVNYEISSLINDVVNMSIMQYEQKRIDFKLQIDENIPSNLFGDELRIKQILNNLLSNAFKYTSDGEIQFSIKAENTNENNFALVFCISDTGQGMTKEQIDKMFEGYKRFNLDKNRTVVGTGLGMVITRNLIKMMNGTIDVSSTPGKGSVFTVHIPQKATNAKLLGKKTAENLQNFNFSNTYHTKYKNIVRNSMHYGKVLIVDDIPSNLDVAKLLLSPYNLQIETVESGFEAIDLIEKGNIYDIVFMDHMMPKMDGIETTKRMRLFGYKKPILALTANAITGQQEMFMASGFDGYISKPIDTRQLNDILNKFVRDKKFGQKEKMEPSPYDPASNNGENNIIIPNVNTATGLALYDRNIDNYLAVLRSYVPNAFRLIDKLHNVSEETLSDYTINIHGLKSINAGIGAEKTRDNAHALEMASKSGNLPEVLAKNEAVLKDAEETAHNVQIWLKNLDARNPKPRLECPDRHILKRLKKSCEDYDMKGIDEAMDELESADYDKDASLVTWLREKINALDFSLAASRLSEYKDKNNE